MRILYKFLGLSSVTLLLQLALAAVNYDVYWQSASPNVAVVDGVYKKAKKSLAVIKDSVSTNLPWHFNVDSSVINAKIGQTFTSGFRTKYMSPNVVKSPIIKKAAEVMKDLYSKNENYADLVLRNVEGRIIERGDFNPVLQACSFNGSKLFGLVLLSDNWKKNDYGEIVIYNDQEEIVRSVHPRFGRIIFLDCGTHFRIAPPNVNVEFRHYFLFLEFAPKGYKNELAKVKSPRSASSFIQKNMKIDLSKYQNLDMEKLNTKKFFTPLGKKIFVYDNVIPVDIIDLLKEFIENHAEYHESPVNEDSADNVKWIIGLDEPTFTKGPLWAFMKQIVAHISGIKTFHPYDITCNHMRRTDNPHVHKDNYYDGDEYTMLIYLNPDWTENNYGETTFLHKNEIVAAVRPRYGRVVVFHGTVDHSAHSGSPDIQGRKITLIMP